MIVPMKKVHVLTLASRRDATTSQLGKLGLLHVDLGSVSRSDDLSTVQSEMNRVDRALQLLPPESSEYHDVPESLLSESGGINSSALVARILELDARYHELNDTEAQLLDERERVEPWGNVSRESIEALDKAGYYPHLYRLVGESKDTFGAEGTHFVLHEDKQSKDVLVVQKDGERAPKGALPRPERTLDEVLDRIRDTQRKREAVEQELSQCASLQRTLIDERERLARELEFQYVRHGMDVDGPVVFVRGWIPEDGVAAVRRAATEHGWGLLVQDPAEDDEVPVQIRRKRVARLIAPVFDLIKTVPGYRERDISLPFLLFFTVFFAMIISDGGYGLLLLGAAIWLSVKFRREQSSAGSAVLLLYVLSIATVIWGAVTGVWFGYQPIAELPFFRDLIIPALDNFEPVSTENLLFVCFTLAGAQLSLAHIWNAVDAVRSPHKLRTISELGWLAVVLGMYNLVLNLVVNAEVYPLLEITPIAIFSGLGAVILFGNQTGNFFKGLAAGLSVPNLIQTALSGINAFADTVSYIRLFAVGLASVEIAIAANQLAMETGNPIALVIILIIGHTLNVAMGAMSVLVHGIRLNMLEFSGHLGMEWSGTEYRPFVYGRQS